MIKENQINRKELVDKLSEKSSLTKRDSDVFIDSFIDVITETICEGKKVNIHGFGAFLMRERAEKTVRNPKTGEKIKTPAIKVPAFKAGKILKDRVNSIE